MLGRLLLRALPGEYSQNSTYTWFPLQTPESMKGFLKVLGTADKFDFQRPGDPGPIANANEYRDAEQVLKSEDFRTPGSKKISEIVKGDGFVGFPLSFRGDC